MLEILYILAIQFTGEFSKRERFNQIVTSSMQTEKSGFAPIIPVNTSSALIASRMQTALANQNWALSNTGGSASGRRCHIFFVVRGQAALEITEATQVEITGPGMFWLPGAANGNFRLVAGSEGFNVSVADDFVSRTVGESPLSSLLRPLLARILVLDAGQIEFYTAELRASFDAMVRESRSQLPGASVMSGLHLGIVLMHLWRACGSNVTLPNMCGAGAATVQRFQQLIELHYRDHLRIEKMAALLGVTRAHLHQACITATGRTPLTLIHDRLIEEATLKLRETQIPVEQVGYSLGFRDPAYFNRFFKRITSQSPAAFRNATGAVRPTAQPASFADWP